MFGRQAGVWQGNTPHWRPCAYTMGFRRPGERPQVVLKPKWFPSSSTCELLNHIPSEPNVQAARVPDHYAGYLVKVISRRKKEIKCVPRYAPVPQTPLLPDVEGGVVKAGQGCSFRKSMDPIPSTRGSIAHLPEHTRTAPKALLIQDESKTGTLASFSIHW